MRWFLATLVLSCVLLVQAQPPVVPEDLIERSRQLRDGRIAFCIVTDGPTADFDRAMAAALASSLLVEAEVYEVPSDFPVYEEQDFLYALYILLVDHCSAFVGMNLAPGAYPNWLTFSRAYAHIPFVFAVTDERYKNLGDIPRDGSIGVSMLSRADIQLISYLQTVPAQDRWRRLPYADKSLMLDRLLDDTIQGAFFWAPDLASLLQAKPEVEGVRTISSDPLQQVEAGLGIGMLSQDTYLRTMLDQAIIAMIEDGTVQQLLEQHSIEGRPGELGR